VNGWLSQRADALSAAAGVDRTALDLSDAEIDVLLDLARIAAHESGDRRNAPLLCYLAGLAQAGGGKSLDELAEAVRSSSS
jgi:Domain of unknown function (DUF6457)